MAQSASLHAYLPAELDLHSKVLAWLQKVRMTIMWSLQHGRGGQELMAFSLVRHS